jgi:hypothetical protein
MTKLWTNLTVMAFACIVVFVVVMAIRGSAEPLAPIYQPWLHDPIEEAGEPAGLCDCCGKLGNQAENEERVM